MYMLIESPVVASHQKKKQEDRDDSVPIIDNNDGKKDRSSLRNRLRKLDINENAKTAPRRDFRTSEDIDDNCQVFPFQK